MRGLYKGRGVRGGRVYISNKTFPGGSPATATKTTTATCIHRYINTHIYIYLPAVDRKSISIDKTVPKSLGNFILVHFKSNIGPSSFDNRPLISSPGLSIIPPLPTVTLSRVVERFDLSGWRADLGGGGWKSRKTDRPRKCWATSYICLKYRLVSRIHR